MAVIWTETAEQALKDVFDNYLARASRLVAEKIRYAIVDRTEILQQFKELGQKEELLKTLNKGHRYLLEYDHKIIYYNQGNNSYITDVFPVRMNPSRLPKRNK